MFQEPFPTQDELHEPASIDKIEINNHLLVPRDVQILNTPYGRHALQNRVSPDVAVHTALNSDINMPQITTFFYPHSQIPNTTHPKVRSIPLEYKKIGIEKGDSGFHCPVCNVVLQHSRSMKAHLRTKHDIHSRINGDRISYCK